MPEVPRVDEFAFILIGCVLLISILTIFWAMPTEPLPYVEPSSVILKIPSGSSKSFDVIIKGKATNVTMNAEGRIKYWISFSKNYFNVVEQTKVKATIAVPEGTEDGSYIGNVLVRSAGGEISIPVEVQVFSKAEFENLSSKTILFGSFSIEKTKISEKIFSREDFEIYKGLFSQQNAKFEFSIPEDKVDKLEKGVIKLSIEETNQVGNLIVLLNDEEILDRKVGNGEIEIEVSKEKLGTSNTIELYTILPTSQFWTTSIYRIKKLEIETFYKDVYSKTFQFSLDPYQAENFLNLSISFVKTNPEKVENLIIKINDQIIFWGTPPLIIFDRTFSKDFTGKPIILYEDNTITFELKKEGRLDVENLRLVINYYR